MQSGKDCQGRFESNQVIYLASTESPESQLKAQNCRVESPLVGNRKSRTRVMEKYNLPY